MEESIIYLPIGPNLGHLDLIPLIGPNLGHDLVTLTLTFVKVKCQGQGHMIFFYQGQGQAHHGRKSTLP